MKQALCNLLNTWRCQGFQLVSDTMLFNVKDIFFTCEQTKTISISSEEWQCPERRQLCIRVDGCVFLLRYIITLDTKFGCITVSHQQKNEQNKKAPVETSPQHMQVCPVIVLVPKYYKNAHVWYNQRLDKRDTHVNMPYCDLWCGWLCGLCVGGNVSIWWKYNRPTWWPLTT